MPRGLDSIGHLSAVRWIHAAHEVVAERKRETDRIKESIGAHVPWRGQGKDLSLFNYSLGIFTAFDFNGYVSFDFNLFATSPMHC